jgi:hypothetical protein
MFLRMVVLSLLLSAAVPGSSALAAEDAGFAKDLKATIALQGMSCDQVVSSKRNADSDYTAACKDGNKYHVFVNAQGRVIVQKL